MSAQQVTPGWSALLTADGAARLADAQFALHEGTALSKIGVDLRDRGVPPDEVAALLTQLELRAKARLKFGDLAASLLFTPAGLEQATRAPVAALHAQRFADAGCTVVADLGCGIGAESLAIQASGMKVQPIEIDPFTAAVAEHNLGCPVRVENAETASLAGIDGVFLDPARRTAGHRNTRRLASPSDYSPSLDFAFGLSERHPLGIKLGPAFDRDLIPDDAEAQWVSVDGQLVETGLWFGATARPGIRRSALLLRGTETHEISASDDSLDAPVRDLGDYLYEPDGAVIRARLIGKLSGQLGAGMVSKGIAYLTGDSLVTSPFTSAFRIIEELPAGEKALRKALSARNIGRLEIKKRGVDVDPAALRARLRLKGQNSTTLILTRVDGRHRALLAERV